MELKSYIAPLRRWWWLLLVTTIVTLISTFLIVRNQPPIYEARATLIVGRILEDPNPDANDLRLTSELVNMYADLANLQPLQASVMTALRLEELPKYTARVLQGTQFLQISVVDTNPELAQAVAREIAVQLMQQTPTGQNVSTQQRQQFLNDQLDKLQLRIGEAESELTARQEELGNTSEPAEIERIRMQIRALQEKLDTLQANYAALLANTMQGASNSLTLIEQPIPEPVGPNKPLTIALAGLLALLLSAGAAYLLEYLDDTVKSPEQAQKLLGLTTLGTVPPMRAQSGTELAALTDTHSPAVEAFRVLRTNLQFASIDAPIRSLLLTSAAPSEGKTITAANLAVVLAQAGQQVIIVDADLHRPRLHRIFRVVNNAGLTTGLLKNDANPATLLQETRVPGLRVLTSGPLPPNAAELLGSQRMRRLLTELENRADFVLLDSPPVMALSDAAILAAQVDGTLLLLDAGKTRREVARQALASLNQVKAKVLGLVMNRVPASAHGSRYYYYYESDQPQRVQGGRRGTAPVEQDREQQKPLQA